MYTSLCWMVLVGAAAPGERVTSPAWMTDYTQAQRQGKKLDRPLAVFLAPGKDGWRKLVKDGQPTAEALKELADSYVCVHIDTTTEAGKKWAGELDTSSGLGLVLSDRSGVYQAHRNEGALGAADLARSLEEHSGKAVTRVSTYPPESVRETTVAPGTTIVEPQPFQGRIMYGPASSGRGCSS